MLDILCFFAINKSMGIHCELPCCSQHPPGDKTCAVLSIASFVSHRPRLRRQPSRPATLAPGLVRPHSPASAGAMPADEAAATTCLSLHRHGCDGAAAAIWCAGSPCRGGQTDSPGPEGQAGRRRKRAERVQLRRVQASARNAPWRLRARGCGTELRPLCVLRQSRADPECRIVSGCPGRASSGKRLQ